MGRRGGRDTVSEEREMVGRNGKRAMGGGTGERC